MRDNASVGSADECGEEAGAGPVDESSDDTRVIYHSLRAGHCSKKTLTPGLVAWQNAICFSSRLHRRQAPRIQSEPELIRRARYFPIKNSNTSNRVTIPCTTPSFFTNTARFAFDSNFATCSTGWSTSTTGNGASITSATA